jgi:anti-anti-sigma factor
VSLDELVEVRLIGLPIDLWRRASAHQEALQREFEIIRTTGTTESVPHRLLELIDSFRIQFGDTSDATWDELRLAAEGGATVKDLTFRVPVAAAGAAREIALMMAEVDAYCQSGSHLLTLATPPDQIALREWILGEFIHQIDGQAPVSWDEFIRERKREEADRIVFDGALDLATAGGLRDEIQERRSRGIRRLVVDLSRVGFVDSIGISLLVTTHNRLEEEGATMRLIAPRRVQELLRLTGLTEILNPEDPPQPAVSPVVADISQAPPND